MSDRLDQLDYYTLLGAPTDASADAVREAFHAFALKFHPDNHGGSPEKLARATEIFRRGTEAYRVLSDARARAAYDEVLAKGQLRLRAEEAAPKKRTASQRGGVGPRAAPFWIKARKAMEAGDLRQAELNLKIALQHEPDNPALLAAMDDVQARLARD